MLPYNSLFDFMLSMDEADLSSNLARLLLKVGWGGIMKAEDGKVGYVL